MPARKNKKKKLNEVELEKQADKLLSDNGFTVDDVSSSLDNQDSSLDNVVSTALVETSVATETVVTQDSSLGVNDVSTISVENQNVNLLENTMSDVPEVVPSVETVSKKKLVLDFIEANPTLAGKNKDIAAALVALGHDVKPEQVAAIKAQNKAKDKSPESAKFDMSSFKQVFAMQKKLTEAGGIDAVENALTVVEGLLTEAGSVDNLKLIIATLKEVETL